MRNHPEWEKFVVWWKFKVTKDKYFDRNCRILKMYADGATQKVIADHYGLSTAYISIIVQRFLLKAGSRSL